MFLRGPCTTLLIASYIDSGHTGQLETEDPNEEDGLNEGTYYFPVFLSITVPVLIPS